MKKFLIILLIIVGMIPAFFFSSAMVIGIYEGVTGKTVISNAEEAKQETVSSKTTTSSNSSSYSQKQTSSEEKPKTSSKPTSSTKQETIKAPIKFGVLEYEQDYVGGNSIRVQVQNTSNKEIKYVRYTLAFFNNVGDPIYDDIRGWHEMQWEVVGPIKPNAYKEFFGGTFYNHQFQGKYSITNLQIVFMDNTSINISNKEFSKYTNLLSNYNDTKVIVWDNGASYHAENCSTIEYNKNRGLKTISASEAKEQGYDRCNICNP